MTVVKILRRGGLTKETARTKPPASGTLAHRAVLRRLLGILAVQPGRPGQAAAVRLVAFSIRPS